MSNLPGNPFEADAQDDPRNMGGTTANALLALAYEQRTATLVHALLSDSLVTDGKYDEIQAEVRQRLGLGENNV